jgi:hypothetical protein
MGEEGQKNEVKKMNVADILLYKNEDRIFKSVGITIRKGLSR